MMWRIARKAATEGCQEEKGTEKCLGFALCLRGREAVLIFNVLHALASMGLGWMKPICPKASGVVFTMARGIRGGSPPQGQGGGWCSGLGGLGVPLWVGRGLQQFGGSGPGGQGTPLWVWRGGSQGAPTCSHQLRAGTSLDTVITSFK